MSKALTKPFVVGRGEVGTALGEVLSREYRVKSYDVLDGAMPIPSQVDVLHICLPYSERFESQVAFYQADCRPQFTIIHSTVPVGVSSRLGAFHSPVRGRQPNLAEAMRTFVTYLAPPHPGLEAYLDAAGFNIETMDKPEETEAAKLWDTLIYGWNILLEKAIHAFCEERGLNFDMVYRDYTESYNRGYELMGESQFVRPVINHVPGPIGGHCVIPNASLLSEESIADLFVRAHAQSLFVELVKV